MSQFKVHIIPTNKTRNSYYLKLFSSNLRILNYLNDLIGLSFIIEHVIKASTNIALQGEFV